MGWAHRFAKGHVPANKGKPMPPEVRAKVARTMFQPGHQRNDTVPLGGTRINRQARPPQLERKISNSGRGAERWRAVHRLVWEAAHGPAPAGHVVVFRPGQRSLVEAEITLDRVECISRVENMRRNTRHQLPKPLNDLISLRAALNRQIRRHERHAPPTSPTPAQGHP